MFSLSKIFEDKLYMATNILNKYVMLVDASRITKQISSLILDLISFGMIFSDM